MLNTITPCPLCMQPININGDHATCCAKSGDLIIRHNTIRNLVHSIAVVGVLNLSLRSKVSSDPPLAEGLEMLPFLTGVASL